MFLPVLYSKLQCHENRTNIGHLVYVVTLSRIYELEGRKKKEVENKYVCVYKSYEPTGSSSDTGKLRGSLFSFYYQVARSQDLRELETRRNARLSDRYSGSARLGYRLRRRSKIGAKFSF